jgi:hypothetical protein
LVEIDPVGDVLVDCLGAHPGLEDAGRDDLLQLAVLSLGENLQFLEIGDEFDGFVALLLRLPALLGQPSLDPLLLFVRLVGEQIALGTG